MYSLLRPLLFSLSPERAHRLTFSMLEFAKHIPGALALVGGESRQRLLAGGDGSAIPRTGRSCSRNGQGREACGCLSRIGFGFIEIGTLTPLAQPGNDQPRLFRLPKDRALINRMGFNNGGVQAR